MSDFKNSITILFFYTMLVMGISQVQYFEENFLDFEPLFFIMFALAILSELLVVGNLIKLGVRISIYFFVGFWATAYFAVWVSYWRVNQQLDIQTLILQFILVELAAGLAYVVGRNVGQLDKTLDGLSSTTYPNRAIEIGDAEERINDELTRSRRYHHSLPVLILELESSVVADVHGHYDPLQRDMLKRFTNAKLGQIISELSRQSDLVLRDRNGQFVILCTETNHENIPIFAERIRVEVLLRLDLTISWGAAVFPDDALSFTDLLDVAKSRLMREYAFDKKNFEIPASQNLRE
jgi:GGDEF domain-containing protein